MPRNQSSHQHRNRPPADPPPMTIPDDSLWALCGGPVLIFGMMYVLLVVLP
jgi:hypothetical protein